MTVEKYDIWRVTHSFKRSGVREGVYHDLCEAYPDGKTVEEIMASTKYDRNMVIGALVGYKDRYRPDDALVALGLVTRIELEYHGRKVTLFKASSDGKDIRSMLRHEQNKSLRARLKKRADHAKKGN